VERRLWNPSLPQTLLIAVFLLYANAVTAVIFRTGKEGLFAVMVYGLTSSIGLATSVGNVLSVLHIAASVGAGILISSERKVGWKLGVAAAAAPLIARAVALATGTLGLGGLISVDLLFDAAVFALLVHPQSREHQRLWFS
jgi:hypothetical protein